MSSTETSSSSSASTLTYDLIQVTQSLNKVLAEKKKRIRDLNLRVKELENLLASKEKINDASDDEASDENDGDRIVTIELGGWIFVDKTPVFGECRVVEFSPDEKRIKVKDRKGNTIWIRTPDFDVKLKKGQRGLSKIKKTAEQD